MIVFLILFVIADFWLSKTRCIATALMLLPLQLSLIQLGLNVMFFPEVDEIAYQGLTAIELLSQQQKGKDFLLGLQWFLSLSFSILYTLVRLDFSNIEIAIKNR